MKKIITTLSFLFVVGLLSVNAQCCGTPEPSCGGSKAESETNVAKSDIKAYYFHGTRRCATCQAVETVAKEALSEYYGNEIVLISINRDEETDNPLIEKYNISGQTLLIVKGNEVVNLTNNAFMNARTKPDKLKAKIKETIDSMK